MPPPPRRTPRATPPPSRRPKVAGLRKPSPRPAPTLPPRPAWRDIDDEQTISGVLDEPAGSAESLTGEEELGSAASTTAMSTTAPSTGDSSAVGGDRSGTGSTAVKPRPSPRRKARQTGTARPASEEELTAGDRDRSALRSRDEARSRRDGVAGRVVPAGRARTRLTVMLAVVALLLAGLAVFFKVMDDRTSAATSNTALIDVAKTSQVKGEVTAAVESLFSYDFNDIAKTERAAEDLLVNEDARNQYNALFAEVKRLAPEQKMVVTLKVTRSAVVMLDGDRAKVLVFGDQTATRTDQNQTSAGGSQFSVDTETRDGKWKITGLNFYTDGAQPQAPAPLPSGQNPPPAPESPPAGN